MSAWLQHFALHERSGGSMPSLNPLSAVDSARNFMNIVKEVNLDEVRERAELPPRVLIVARDAEHASMTGRNVFGADATNLLEYRSGEDVGSIDSSRYDIIVVSDPEHSSLFENVRSQATNGRRDHIHFLADDGHATVAALRGEILLTDPELAPSVGRHFLELRAAAIHTIIDSTSKANAKFALISNVPAIVPIFGSLLAAGADFIVLTKNQVMMSYKLAAANGRDLEDQTKLLRELVPVVGVGFVWRSVAREATSFLPLLAGTVPKVAIAFVGTYTVGRAVDYYYRFGTKPPKEQWALFREQAVKLAATLPLPGKHEREVLAEEAIESSLEASVAASGDTRPLAPETEHPSESTR
jgi:uncharacterized protein (DUF697 family)